MTIRIPIRSLLQRRHGLIDRTLLDYLDLAVITPDPGIVTTAALRQRWRCSQPMVSRRMAAINEAGLADVTTTYGGYHVHWLDHVQP